jgi:hypothetical protein
MKGRAYSVLVKVLVTRGKEVVLIIEFEALMDVALGVIRGD